MAHDFDTGRQARLDIVANGVVLLTATITDFEDKQKSTDLQHRPLNGPTKNRKLPDGWDGDFSLDRNGPALDDYFSQEETDYYAGVDGAEIYITKTIDEGDGSISQYRHEGVVLKFDSAGKWEQNQKVQQKVSFMSSQRPKIA